MNRMTWTNTLKTQNQHLKDIDIALMMMNYNSKVPRQPKQTLFNKERKIVAFYSVAEMIVSRTHNLCNILRFIFKFNFQFQLRNETDMELFRNQLEKQTSSIFDGQPIDDMCAKVTTEVFDKTLPSELQFEDTTGTQSNSQNLKQGEAVSLQQSGIVSQSDNKSTSVEQTKKQLGPSEYDILTKNILNYTFKKIDNGTIIRKIQHSIGSFIPYELKIKTFQVKFFDELSELSKGVSTFRLLWKSVVGYVKTQLYIKNGFIYLLEKRKQGFVVQSIWDIQDLFKLFSDKQENKLRLVFRTKDQDEIKLLTKQIETGDLNFLAHLFEQARNLDIVSAN